ncbi:quercetin 2,3-dioxygenase [Cohnella sp. WQ 127256]|uniref:quercetin 2,3-dioxygenase n=1 Tax=Cohnella sp. WQ 127256 TaxID=2938790 RepID=UPI002117B760|nr:quercetin 2,3-dioxygenase [Cohnella sp. WQ 127256]
MTYQLSTILPHSKSPYMIPTGEGDRYVFGTQVASVLATIQSTGDLVEVVQLSGGRGDEFPSHVHNQANEGIYVLDGRLELDIGTQTRLLTAGDFAHIPAGTAHGYRMRSHRTRFLSVTIGGAVASIYSTIGDAYAQYERPPESACEARWSSVDDTVDIKFLNNEASGGISSQIYEGKDVPESVQPYVLEAGEGVHLISGEQVHTLISTQAATDGKNIFVISEGPKGVPIGEHYHNITNEIFYCVQGQMTLWVDGEELHLHPGDFAYVPAGVRHRFSMDSHYTKFLGVLTPGSFEEFFRTLGDPYPHPIFPREPVPYRFDRVIKRITELDLVVTGKPPVITGSVPGHP